MVYIGNDLAGPRAQKITIIISNSLIKSNFSKVYILIHLFKAVTCLSRPTGLKVTRFKAESLRCSIKYINYCMHAHKTTHSSAILIM